MIVRGNQRQKIFTSDSDYRAYIERLARYRKYLWNKKPRRSIETVGRELAKLLKLEVQALRSPDRSWAVSKARTMAAYVLVRRLGYRLSDVAA